MRGPIFLVYGGYYVHPKTATTAARPLDKPPEPLLPELCPSNVHPTVRTAVQGRGEPATGGVQQNLGPSLTLA